MSLPDIWAAIVYMQIARKAKMRQAHATKRIFIVVSYREIHSPRH